jgi:branched-chain amino acid aminotransferase
MKEPIYFFNGQYLPESQCHISVNDLGLLRGYGVFDFFKVVNGHVIFQNDHLNRLEFSTAQLHIDLPYTRTELEDIISKIIQANPTPLLGIKIIVTGGYSVDGYTPTKPNFVVIANTWKNRVACT